MNNSILFVNPPNISEIELSLPSFVKGEKGVTPPLGILSIASYIKINHPQIEINFIDAQADVLDYKSLKSRISEYSPDVIGITVMSQTVRDVLKTIECIKIVHPDAVIALGGPHVTCYPDETIAWKDVDFVFYGECEKSFSNFLKSFYYDKSYDDIGGLIYKENGKIIKNRNSSFVEDLDELPYIDRSLINNSLYSSVVMSSEQTTSLMTSRGCPFHCNYCDRPTVGKKFRTRSVENIIKELKECVQLGIRSFLFYDDTFTVKRDRVINICNAIIQSNLQIKFNIRSRVDKVDLEMLILLKKAGCNCIQYGVESGSQTILDNMKKGISIEQIEKAFTLTRKAKIQTIAYFMFGNPGETISDIEKSIRFMNKLNPDYVMISVFTPFPRTVSYENGVAKGVFTDVWKILAENPFSEFSMPYWSENFKKEELYELMISAYKRFYFKKSRIFKALFNIRSLKDFYMKSKAAKHVLFAKKKMHENTTN